MLKIFFISGLIFGSAALELPSQVLMAQTESQNIQQEEKFKIEANNLPDAIKAVVKANSLVKDLPIIEAWQIPQIDGSYHYEIFFDDESEEKITKTYDNQGKEIKK